ncbi:ABC transporter substrate-binding protein [candidate division KSB3 bacterium]|uniref:ABC transporter substrate-binding protein n=1 Tax=candidate division KSB3 bacterium TaxID=2044937 RepID=A0A2G6KKH1_9BACT|nr:MAG: ABC transporter substrate-binding protein [candidate division KSB3 bacterium]
MSDRVQSMKILLTAFRFMMCVGLLLSAGTILAEEPVYIALSVPITGNYAEYGSNIKRAVELAINEANSKGGIHGRPIELVIGDSKGTPKESATLAQKFVSDSRIVAQIGDFTSTCSLAAQPIYQRAKMVQLTPTSTHPDFAPGSPYSFSIAGKQTEEGPFMARFAINTLGKKKIAFLYVNNDWGIAMRDHFIRESESLGAEIIAQEAYFDGTTDFTAILTKFQSLNPDLLYLTSMYNDGALISNQRQKLGWDDVTVMGAGSLYSPKFIDLGGKAVEGVFTSCVFFPGEGRPEVQQFVSGFEKQYDQTPNVFAAVAYDSARLVIAAIRQAGTDRQAICKALASVKDFPGVTGKITFSEVGDVVKEYRKMVVKDGKFQLYQE